MLSAFKKHSRNTDNILWNLVRCLAASLQTKDQVNKVTTQNREYSARRVFYFAINGDLKIVADRHKINFSLSLLSLQTKCKTTKRRENKKLAQETKLVSGKLKDGRTLDVILVCKLHHALTSSFQSVYQQITYKQPVKLRRTHCCLINNQYHPTSRTEKAINIWE